MSGSGKDVLGMVGISWDGVRAGTFPDNKVHTIFMLSMCLLLQRMGQLSQQVPRGLSKALRHQIPVQKLKSLTFIQIVAIQHVRWGQRVWGGQTGEPLGSGGF